MAFVHAALECNYKLKETIGSGGFAKVKLAYHLITNEKVAIKIIDKRSDEVKNELKRVYNEIAVLKQLRHHHICQLYEVIETDTHVYLVIEFCAEGELFDYIVSRTHLTESDARYYFRQILSAIAYTHRRGIAHRDLKPENLLLDEEQNCKLIDFGLCSQPQNGLDINLKTCCGSPSYAAPEVISGKQYSGPAVDVWSLGVILYALLCGCLPFEDENIGNLFKKIQRGCYRLPAWLSADSADLLAQMMCIDHRKRISIEELCLHPWVTYGYNDSPVQSDSRYESNELDVDCVIELAVYHGMSKGRMTKALLEWRFDQLTASYLILLNKKERGLPITLSNPSINLFLKSPSGRSRRPISVHLDQPCFETGEVGSIPGSPLYYSYENKENIFGSPCSGGIDSPTFAVPNPPRRSALNCPLSPSRSVDSQLGQRRQHQNFRSDVDSYDSPAINSSRALDKIRPEGAGLQQIYARTEITEKDRIDEIKLRKQIHTICQGLCLIGKMGADIDEHDEHSASGQDELDAEARNSPKTPKTPLTRSVFGSLERHMDRVRQLITPKRKGSAGCISAQEDNTPSGALRKISAKHNVTTYSDYTPESVLNRLVAALEHRYIRYKRRGYILRCQLCSDWGKTLLAFDLEVCLIAKQSQVVGVRRKRVKGDMWHYKRLCEDILHLAQENQTCNLSCV